MKKILRIILVLIIIGLLVGVMYFLYQKSQPKPIVWKTEKPFKSTIVQKTIVTGSINPRKEIQIKPQINGIVHTLYVEAGDYVKEGDLIAKIAIIPEMMALENARGRLKKSEIRLNEAETVYKRQKELFEKKVIAELDFLKYEVSYLNAKEDYKASENNLLLVEKGVLNSSDKSSNTFVYSTATGMVLQVPIKKGNSVIKSNSFNDGTTIAVVANMNDMIFQGFIDESEVGKLKEGMDLDISIGALQDVKLDAKLEHISPKGKIENGAIQFEIKAKINTIDTIYLRAGYSANADIILEKRDSVLSVKESWLTFKKDTAFVEVEKMAQKFDKRKLKLGLSDGINIQVLEGVNENEVIKTNSKL